MNVQFCPITVSEADEIATWRYQPPYDFYNWDPADDPAELLIATPPFLAAHDDLGNLVGFLCFGAAAQVPGGRDADLYRDNLLDIGLGMRPDFTGRGIGQAFFEAALKCSAALFQPRGFRLTVATFNERAIRVYERIGFERGERCVSIAHGTETEFILMTNVDQSIAPPRKDPEGVRL
jgi:ribosomal protein S18 acetylase RimI-like enzyme